MTTLRALDTLLAVVAAGLAVMVIASARPNPPVGLDRDPLDLPALRRLGLEADRQGRKAEAEKLLDFVSRQTWRDGPTEAWLVRTRLRQGRYDEAFRSADSLLRRDDDGATRPILYAMFTAAAAYPDARRALEARLATSPDWRGDVMTSLALRGDAAGAGEVFADLADGPSPPTPAEYAPYVQRRVAAGDYRGARAAWERIARPGGAARPATSGDAFFEPPDQTPFTWSTSSGEGWSSELGPSPDLANRRALRVEYDGFSAARLPALLLVLGPGRYRLAWRESADPHWRARLTWALSCADTGEALPSSTAAVSTPPGPSAGIDRATDFSVPVRGCQGQWLRLAATPAERRDPVTTWFEAFDLRRLPGP